MRPRRFAGASAGAFTATLLAASYSAEEYSKICRLPLGELLMGKIGNVLLSDFFKIIFDCIVHYYLM